MSIKVRQNGKYLIEMLIYYSGIHFIAWIFVLQANKNPEYHCIICMAQVYFITPLKNPAFCLRPFGPDFWGGFERKLQKKFIMEVKTVKTRKSTEWCKIFPKSAKIWNQTVLSITQARNEIFQKFQSPE